MTHIHSFKPIEDQQAKVLILGSMPGQASLAADQYYAHTQNAFWRIMSELLQFNFTYPYELKVQALKSAQIALWDVLQSCKRQGSLDAMIERDTQIANDFWAFFQTHPHITHVFFNGAKAEHLFKQHVLQHINNNAPSLLRLPSTSPANAAMTFQQKLDAWRIILESGQPITRC